jgi:hypothetical protein
MANTDLSHPLGAPLDYIYCQTRAEQVYAALKHNLYSEKDPALEVDKTK